MDEINAKKSKMALIYMAVIMGFVFSVWHVLLNNFAFERASFTGSDMGDLHSVREIPGFLAFTAVFFLIFLREQTFAILALVTLCIGIFATGYFPTKTGLLATTFIMSVGFHYFETINSSLTLQWLPKSDAPAFMGKVIAFSACAALTGYAIVWVCVELLEFEYNLIFSIFAVIGLIMIIHLSLIFPKFEAIIPQKKHLFLKKRYWVYYVLTFLSGARRQIFMVFAAFLLVEKFGFSAGEIATLFLINKSANVFIAPQIGKIIGYIGEKRALTIEYSGLIAVFVGYALVNDSTIAAGLYIVDHLFFAMAIAIKTYFQKIADSEDMAATASVSFTIDHIASVIIPVTFGIIWMYDPALVFYAGAGFAACSLITANLISRLPSPGNEFIWSYKKQGV